MSETAIRLLRPEDHKALTALMVEMQGHYSVPCPAPEDILAGLAALPAGVDILVAVKGGAVLGFASACNLYPGPGLKTGFFLKEIYVADAARGPGQLADALVGCPRLVDRIAGHPRRLLHLPTDLGHRGCQLFGRRGDRLHVGSGLLGCGRDRRCQPLRPIGRRGERPRGGLQLGRGRRNGRAQ